MRLVLGEVLEVNKEMLRVELAISYCVVQEEDEPFRTQKRPEIGKNMWVYVKNW